jgi:hypothetical protein
MCPVTWLSDRFPVSLLTAIIEAFFNRIRA